MHNHKTRRTIESQLFPGVEYDLRVPSYGRRNEVIELCRSALRKLDTELKDEASLKAVHQERYLMQLVRIRLTAMLLDVRGLEIDGQSFGGRLVQDRDAALTDLLENGPEDLVTEIFVEISKDFRVDEEEAKNSEPLSGTSPREPESGTNAAPVNETSSGVAATAGSFTPRP